MTEIIVQFAMKMWWVWLVCLAFLVGAWLFDGDENYDR